MPPVFYHASTNGDIQVFTPRAERVRDASEGPQVFATPSKALATVFIVKTDDSWANSGTISGVPYMIISDRERFETLDIGGYIYELPPETFTNDATKGLGHLEGTSAVPVVPTGKEYFKSGLDAMLDAGVQVYFLDKETYLWFKNDPSHMAENLNQLTSENQKLQKNVSYPFIA